MKEPLVSIITPVYNCERYLADTIESILSQTYENWELLLINDASQDGSSEIAKHYQSKDHRIHLFHLSSNSGAAVARNLGLTRATGKYVAFLDGDDLWKPQKLARQVHFMEKNNYLFTFTSYRIMREDGRERHKVVPAPKQVSYDKLLSNTIIGCLTVMINQEALGKLQMPTIRTRQDLMLWLAILKKGHIAYGMNEELAAYRKVGGSISSNKWKAAKQNWHIYRKHEALPLLKCCFIFCSYAWNGVKKL
ncbi:MULTISPECIES: glycosyltransferase family 2 protein [Shouchella]|uniref:Glycosyltransferase family 2 protein n=2 Tax=Shouchella TaxID=2893057 RepID=A0ABY7W9C3_9BACI|nr:MULTISPECIES: glycosyltransferase family 2 protein [Shouchella]MED4127779.1 glycosyltransferase family 2 protein [Shouchella miscanthi]WDF05241.1 glycosyltransferase family 2 protein [Shouchella hunanensis]